MSCLIGSRPFSGVSHASQAGRAAVVRFGEFALDLRSGELSKNGRRLLLPVQPFRILALLVRSPGTLVTRDDLRRELWRDDTFVDFEHSLNAAIKRLRQALGDPAATPRFIETLPRRGYRFTAAVDAGSSHVGGGSSGQCALCSSCSLL